ncbi:hypothetical protein [Nakamurella endophytica]|nr:hypothetical protein [Nakamurella endophytica]
MIADYNLNSWSQVGAISGYNLDQYFWAEVVLHWNNGSPDERYDRFIGSPLTYGVRHAYTEKWVASCPAPTNHSCEESFVDSTRVTDTDFNPFGNFAGGPTSPPRWSPQYSAEKTYQESQIQGDPSTHAKFTSIGVQQFSNNAFVLEPCTLSIAAPQATYAGRSSSGCVNIDVWATN